MAGEELREVFKILPQYVIWRIVSQKVDVDSECKRLYRVELAFGTVSITDPTLLGNQGRYSRLVEGDPTSTDNTRRSESAKACVFPEG